MNKKAQILNKERLRFAREKFKQFKEANVTRAHILNEKIHNKAKLSKEKLAKIKLNFKSKKELLIKKAKNKKKLFQYGVLIFLAHYAISFLAYYYWWYHTSNAFYFTLGILHYSMSWILLMLGLYFVGKSIIFKKLTIMFSKSGVKENGQPTRING